MKNLQLKQNGRFYYGWVITLLGFLLMTFAYVGCVSLTSIFVLPVTEDLGLERGAFMTYVTLLSLACIVVSPFAGKAMQKKNPKIVVAIGCVMGFLGYLGFSQSSSLTAFYLFSLILGVCFAMTAPAPVSIMINSWFGGKVRGTATGIAFIGSGIGGAILSPILNTVIQHFGWRVGYVVLGCVFLVILLPLTLLLYVKRPEDKGFTRMGELSGEAAVTPGDGEVSRPGLDLKQALRTPELWLAALSAVFVVFASSAILANDVSFYVECGMDSTRAASIHGIMLGSMVIGKPLMGMLIDKLGIKIGSTISTFIFAAVFVSLSSLPVLPALVYAVVVTYCLGAPSITIVPPLTVNGLFGEKDYGTIVGVMNTATSIGGAFGGMIAARVYDATGSYVTFWVIAAVFVVVSALIRLLAFRLNQKRNTWSAV